MRTRPTIYQTLKVKLGIGHMLGAFPNPSDMQYLEDVWRGKA